MKNYLYKCLELIKIIKYNQMLNKNSMYLAGIHFILRIIITDINVSRYLCIGNHGN